MMSKKYEKGRLIVSSFGTVFFAEMTKDPNIMSLSRKDVTNDFIGCIIEYTKAKHPNGAFEISYGKKIEAFIELITDQEHYEQTEKLFRAVLSDEYNHLSVAELKKLFPVKPKA